MKKVVVAIQNPGEAAHHNGQTIHALQLARKLDEAGAEVVLVFQAKGVTWIPRFANRNEESHPFVRNYGDVYDAIQHKIVACNMCCIRFDVREPVDVAGVPIVGEGREHIDIAQYVLDDYQIINH